MSSTGVTAMDAAAERDARSAARDSRATRYFELDLAGQRSWYSKNATRWKRRGRTLGFAVIATGAATTFLQVFGQAQWVSVATALLGALVALAEGWRQIARYDETWAAYRAASENMKRERRLYVNGAGAYRGLTDEDTAFLRFIDAIEAIIAEEQQIYWRDRSNDHDIQSASTHEQVANNQEQRS